MRTNLFEHLVSAILIFGIFAACALFLVGPGDSQSSLVIGRIVLDNKYPGGLSGLLPLGVLDKALDVEIEPRDGKQYFKVEVYIPRTGKLFAECWYSATAKRAVKEREFLADGLREAELTKFKVS